MSTTDESGKLEISIEQGYPVFSFKGYCTDANVVEMKPKVSELAGKGMLKFVFDFTDCIIINSLGMGELLDAILLIDQDYEGTVALCGLDSIKETLFTVSGIIPIAIHEKTLESAIACLKEC